MRPTTIMTAPVPMPVTALAMAMILMLAATTAMAGPGHGPGQGPGQGPVRVVVYPDSARIQERAEIALQDASGAREAVFTLPAAADPESLSVAVQGKLRLAGVAVERVALRDEARIAETRDRLEALRIKAQDLADARESHLQAAQYWRAQAKAEAESANEARAMSQLLRDGLYAQLAKASALDREKAGLDTEIAELQKRLDELTGGAETAWEVRATVEGATDKAAPKDAVLDFSYLAGNCGWTPACTLDARPDRGEVHMAWDATVRQATGRDWDGAEVILATARFHGGAKPPELRPWVIGERRPVVMRQANAKLMMDMAAAPAAEESMAGAAEPPMQQRLVFDEYALGAMTLASGGSRRVTLRQAAWKASFDWLVRPQQAPRAFLRASVALDEAPRIPAGPASFLLDGALVRRRHFDLYAKDFELFFGADPQIVVTADLKERTEGTAGFVSGKKTMDWQWRVTVKNAKSVPVAVRLEDATPRPANEKIEVQQRLPGAQVKDRVAAWTLDLAPGAQAAVDYGYTVQWPKDMDVDLGGR